MQNAPDWQHQPVTSGNFQKIQITTLFPQSTWKSFSQGSAFSTSHGACAPWTVNVLSSLNRSRGSGHNLYPDHGHGDDPCRDVYHDPYHNLLFYHLESLSCLFFLYLYPLMPDCCGPCCALLIVYHLQVCPSFFYFSAPGRWHSVFMTVKMMIFWHTWKQETNVPKEKVSDSDTLQARLLQQN